MKLPVPVYHIIFGFQGAFARISVIIAELPVLTQMQICKQARKNYIYQYIKDLREPKDQHNLIQRYTS